MAERMKLQRASVAARNAAFDAVHRDVMNLIDRYVPFMFKGQVLEHFNSQQGIAETLRIIDDALDAAEAAEQ